MEHQDNLIVLPFIIETIFQREPVALAIDVSIASAPFYAFQLCGQELVVEYEEHP